MEDLSELQLRLIYSLLKPAIRAAGHFGVPIRSLTDLVRLAYFEHYQQRGLSVEAIGRRFGQTPRHMRSLARRMESNFFAAEREVGLTREIEAFVFAQSPSRAEIDTRFRPTWSARDIDAALDALRRGGRVEWDDAGEHLRTARRYVVFGSDGFHARIDAINHFFEGGYRAVMHRVIYDDAETATLKTISFSALRAPLRAFFQRLEGELRRELAALDEEAAFAGAEEQRHTLALALAPATEEGS